MRTTRPAKTSDHPITRLTSLLLAEARDSIMFGCLILPITDCQTVYVERSTRWSDTKFARNSLSKSGDNLKGEFESKDVEKTLATMVEDARSTTCL